MTNLPDLHRGDTDKYLLTFQDKPGNPVDITGTTIWFTIKVNCTFDDINASLQKKITTHTDALNGKSEIDLTHDDTNNLSPGIYYYDIQLVDGDEVTTVLYGNIRILPDVTRDIV